ncbi:hypothetical protein [Deinococcus hopiensis]|uniref:Uncharacterized protein n=1 Tax=Deinococcus hopiensis KR-140 TaxID=695939 RepID=A0A1W1VL19_9DEIO|nr:hypothetical protein [Deinococcus hopiensis]SMB94047.1 hypothetical protein SAMN00790413_02225 [Deinococcus hopiensis KR-140]
MEELTGRIVVGSMSDGSGQDRIALIPGSVTEEDWQALLRAQRGDGQVLLNTEHGQKRYRIADVEGDLPTFYIVSVEGLG